MAKSFAERFGSNKTIYREDIIDRWLESCDFANQLSVPITPPRELVSGFSQMDKSPVAETMGEMLSAYKPDLDAYGKDVIGQDNYKMLREAAAEKIGMSRSTEVGNILSVAYFRAYWTDKQPDVGVEFERLCLGWRIAFLSLAGELIEKGEISLLEIRPERSPGE